MLSCGQQFMVAIIESEDDRKVYACGDNIFQQFCQNDQLMIYVMGSNTIYPTPVSCGSFHTLLLDNMDN